METQKDKSEDDMIDAISIIQEALIDLYLNVKVRSKEEISKYSEEDLAKERENLYLTSPIDLINYIQTSVEILMNIKVEDYIAHQKEQQRRDKIKLRKRKGSNSSDKNENNKYNKKNESSKKLNDSELKSDDFNEIKSSRHSSTSNKKLMEIQNSKSIEKDVNEEAGMKEIIDNFKTISSNKTSSPGIKEDVTESFIPFSERTSMTHPPSMYEELIQKYEGDIRNHIRIEQQMKLHSDSVINKLEDKEKQYDKLEDRIKNFKKEAEEVKIEIKVIKEENDALKKALEAKIERVLNVERDLKDSNSKYDRLEREFHKLKKRLTDAAITPKRHDSNDNGIQIAKAKFKSNSANPNSGRKGGGDSVQMFYSRNGTGPNNYVVEEFVIPVTCNRIPQQKFTVNPGMIKNMMYK